VEAPLNELRRDKKWIVFFMILSISLYTSNDCWCYITSTVDITLSKNVRISNRIIVLMKQGLRFQIQSSFWEIFLPKILCRFLVFFIVYFTIVYIAQFLLPN
jgi:hypothetical protein